MSLEVAEFITMNVMESGSMERYREMLCLTMCVGVLCEIYR